MKQHITIKQLHELVGKQDEILYEWCKKKGYLTKEGSIPLLSIGQMIEFLGDEYWNNDLFRDEGWIKSDYDGELCDALWEAVKEVLK